MKQEQVEIGKVYYTYIGEQLSAVMVISIRPADKYSYSKRTTYECMRVKRITTGKREQSFKCPGDWTGNNESCGACAVHKNEHACWEKTGVPLPKTRSAAALREINRKF
jgi:hypothetical protein